MISIPYPWYEEEEEEEHNYYDYKRDAPQRTQIDWTVSYCDVAVV
jgi:hypothetical protein